MGNYIHAYTLSIPFTLGTLPCDAACCASCEELDCDNLMYDFNCISWKGARILNFKALESKYVSGIYL